MKFEVVKYEVFALNDKSEVMKVTLNKDVEYQENSKIIGVQQEKKPKGISGHIELMVYEKPDQDRFRSLLGKFVELGLK